MNFAVIAVQFGHTGVVMDHWDAVSFLQLVRDFRVTHSHMMPTRFRRLLAVPSSRRPDVSSMRAMIHGAAPCPLPVKRQMLEWFGPVVIEYYAASEGGGPLIAAAEWLARPGSVGRAWPGSRVRVLDDDGRDRPPGVPGSPDAGGPPSVVPDPRALATRTAGGADHSQELCRAGDCYRSLW